MKSNLDSFSLREASTLRPDDVDRLERIAIPHSREWAEWFGVQVKNGAARLSHVEHAGRIVGTLLWRIEDDVERELVVMSAAASDPAVPVRAFLAESVDAIARAEKCTSARFHTIRPGLVQFAHSRGWHTSEIVLRKSYVS